MLAAALGNKATLMERLWEGTPKELIAIRSEEVQIYREHGGPAKADRSAGAETETHSPADPTIAKEGRN